VDILSAITVGEAMRTEVETLTESLPPTCVIANLRRGDQAFAPRGATTLRAGDVLVVVSDSANRNAVEQAVREVVKG